MRFDKQRLSVAILALAVATGGACRRSASGSDSANSARTSARADTAPSPAAGTPMTRTDSVVLRTDKAQYRAGEKMTLTFENKSASSYTFNPCTRSLQREDGSSWTDLPDEGRMCTMEAWILDPHGTRTGPTELPSSLAPGRYRVLVRMGMEQPGGTSSPPVVAMSDPITVS
jgi:Bacterial Ig-like domain